LLQIRLMKITDFASIIRLTDREQWGFGIRELRRMMALEPKGCLVATVNGRLIGLTVAITYGKSCGWIGNVVVDRKDRGAGIGSRLVQSAIRYLLRGHVKTIALYSYPENEAMYKRLGFSATDSFARLSMSEDIESSRQRTGRVPLNQILSLDRRAFGADRSRLLRRVYREFPKSWAWVIKDDMVYGYSLVKRYKDSSEIGPMICEPASYEPVATLLRSSISLVRKWPLEMSVPEPNLTVLEAATSIGFRVEKKGIVMSYTRLHPAVVKPSIGALGFLDKG
jgi:predicted N-acetyltransferase YhbS